MRPLLAALAGAIVALPASGTVIDPALSETQLLPAVTGLATGMAWAPDGSNRLFVLDKRGAATSCSPI